MTSQAQPEPFGRPERPDRPTVTPQLAIGLFIIIIGLLLTLDRLRILDASQSFRLWPVALILTGVTVMSRTHDRRGRLWGFAWIFLGSWLLLNTLGLVRVGFWELFWPLAITLLGVKLVMDTIRPGTPWSPGSRAWGGPGGSNLFAVMGESKRSINEHPFRGGSLTAFMGGCHLDLRQATIPPGEEAAIEVFAMMGGLEIWVPSGWAVTSKVLPIMGSVEDKRLLPPSDAPIVPGDTAPRLLLRGILVMGGLTIKH
jgi:hypothetical protein